MTFDQQQFIIMACRRGMTAKQIAFRLKVDDVAVIYKEVRELDKQGAFDSITKTRHVDPNKIAERILLEMENM